MARNCPLSMGSIPATARSAAGLNAVSSSTPFGSPYTGSDSVARSSLRRITPPFGSGVVAVYLSRSSPRLLTAPRWKDWWIARTGFSVDTASRSSRVGCLPSVSMESS